MKKILFTIIKIRCNQFFRQLKEIGWIYLLLLLPLLLIFILRILEWVQKGEIPVVGIGILFLLLLFHFQRKDIGFLSQLDLSPVIIFVAEYFLCLLPVSLLFLFATGRGLEPLIIQLGALLIAFIPRKHKWSKKWDLSLFLNWPNVTAFEWRMGLRRYLPFWALLYLLALAFSNYTAAIPVFILVFTFNASSFYDPLEGKELLETLHFREYLLTSKLKSQLLVFHGLMLPHYGFFLFWHTQYWYILLVLIILAQLLLLMSLFYKYANYQPSRIKVQNQVVVSVFAACLFNPLMPVLFPGIILYLYRYWRKAQNNLRLYYAEN